MAKPESLGTKAYVVAERGAPFILQDVFLDEIQPSEVLVEILYTGICHTDIVVQQGGMPIGGYPCVLGHEGVGIVKQVGADVENASLRPGDTVLLSFHTCRDCSACKDGRLGSCPQMTATNFINTARRGPGAKSPIFLPDGTPVHGQFFGQSSLGKHAVVAEHSVVKIDARPEDLQFLAPLSCGYLTGAGTVINVLRPQSHTRLAVLGMGAVGLAAMLAAKAIGVQEIIAVDIVDAKLRLASELGATHLLNSKGVTDLSSGIRSIFHDGVDQIIDTTGVAALLQQSFDALAHEGTLALVGVPNLAATLQVNALDWLLSCKRLIGVIEGSANPREV